MRCPKCDAKLGLDDRICPACKFSAEAGRVIDVAPPRASRSFARRLVPERLLGRIARSASRARLPIVGPMVRIMAAVVPGLGHLLAWRIRAGLAYAAVVILLFDIALELMLRGMNVPGQIAIGLAAGVHAQSMLSLTSLQTRTSHKWRLGFLFSALYFLLAFIYWPVTERMNRRISRVAEMERVWTHRSPIGLQQSDAVLGSIGLAILFVALACVSVALAAAWGDIRDTIRSRRKPT